MNETRFDADAVCMHSLMKEGRWELVLYDIYPLIEYFCLDC